MFVWQIHSQFPLSFEFNEYYLKFLAYHHVSNRFRTFMMDSEFSRMEAGWLLEEGRSVVDRDNDSSSSSHRIPAGMSVWEYIDNHQKKSPVFYNFRFSDRDNKSVRDEVRRSFFMFNLSELFIGWVHALGVSVEIELKMDWQGYKKIVHFIDQWD